MHRTAVILESVEYRVILVEAESRAVLALDIGGSYTLPRVCIPKGTRPAQHLQAAIHSTWGLNALILDFVEADGSSLPCVIAMLLNSLTDQSFKRLDPTQLSCSELTDIEHSTLLSVFGCEGQSPFCRLGWLSDATAWIETATGRKLSSKTDIEQLNAGGRFALVRFHMDDGSDLWLKATGEPNTHELSTTLLVSKLCGRHVPRILATRPEWNAWIMSGEDLGIPDSFMDPVGFFRMLEDAVQSMAGLQIQTLGSVSALLNAGAFDQRLEVLLSHSDAMFDYLDEVTELSATSETPRLEHQLLRDIQDAFIKTGERVQHLNIPDTILHGDMSLGNIVVGRDRCQFVDWSEAFVGPCLVTLEHMLLLNGVENPKMRDFMNRALKNKYLDVWSAACDREALRQGLDYMPLIAVVSALYGRGDWLDSPKRYDAHRLSYARTLAACMDRASKSCARSHRGSLVSVLAGQQGESRRL
jgi:hypothetical protein